jgi:Streptomyces sporulation and cell division protein, SsgA
VPYGAARSAPVQPESAPSDRFPTDRTTTVTETVSCEIVLGDGRPWRGHLPVLRLSWSAGDPLAVVLVVGARPPHPSLLRGRWVVLRDTLRSVLAPGGGSPSRAGAGAPRPAGHVQMSRQDEHVTLTLRSVSLPCVVSVPAAPLREFLAETDALVPPGQEPCTPALDAELARMLRQS